MCTYIYIYIHIHMSHTLMTFPKKAELRNQAIIDTVAHVM